MIVDVNIAFDVYIRSCQRLNALKRNYDHCVNPANKIYLFKLVEKQKKIVTKNKLILDQLETELEAKLEA